MPPQLGNFPYGRPPQPRPLLISPDSAHGIDAIHFGIIMAVNLSIGLYMPPFGLNLFAARAVFNVPMGVIYRGVLPFVVVNFLALLVITYVPAISMALVGAARDAFVVIPLFGIDHSFRKTRPPRCRGFSRRTWRVCCGARTIVHLSISRPAQCQAKSHNAVRHVPSSASAELGTAVSSLSSRR